MATAQGRADINCPEANRRCGFGFVEVEGQVIVSLPCEEGICILSHTRCEPPRAEALQAANQLVKIAHRMDRGKTR